MWTYSQSTGALSHDGAPVSTGYAGHGPGKNNPRLQAVPNIGPIPRGRYTIGQARDTKDHGPVVLPLTPDAANQMFGRSALLVHGDSIKAPGTASRGCIIMPRAVREQIAASDDRELTVIV